MERRVFVAILLSFAVLYGYQALFVPPQKPEIDVVETEGTDAAVDNCPAGDTRGCRAPPARRSPPRR